ncbi:MULTISPECIES: sulfite exporter TauE/SafE family protein [unclassified Acinetobacter]|uniref:sulfite exporter TauE/SafE family protein n=1 Tax=unclassified Acinetobacter TaxID=196816 RepID=UPI0029352AB5|nr:MULTISPECIES: sulfite exporter TauE/SafE family protein [unclassified Acinetobacter]WOE32881.1 sulfite exporter TauE/SafE family protein [Acinetobacter sp. SAAs470]WOE38358.1 sulfite exporter TauE/SafE family protein [Acinetobacter sp. SAAs474]
MWMLILEGLLIGTLLGLTGAGGGILAVPALIASQGWNVTQAAPVGLLAITLSALIGSVEGLLKKIVRYRAALWIALMSIPAAHYGVQWANIISPTWLTVTFSLIMLWVAYRIFFKQDQIKGHALCQVNHQTGRLIWNINTTVLLAIIGLIAGLLTGLLGVGGGFVIVPALRKVTNLDMKSIVATSLMIIFLIGMISIVMHLLDGFDYPQSITVSFVMACIGGMLFGRILINKINMLWVQKIFATTVIAVAFYLIASVIMS